MGTLFDYLDWRGDVSFADLGLNEVDNLIFSLISYVDFEGIVPRDPSATPVTLLDAARGYLRLHRGEVPYLGKILPPETITLMAKASKTKRFAGCKMTGYVNRVDEETQTQFSALTYIPNNGVSYLAFRGTDDTLVGWKENFNMSFMQPVPAQERAVEYVREMAPYLPAGFYLGGHSKGGNLATYAAVKASDATKERIVAVYSNDAPGFASEFICSKAYSDMRKKIHTYLPQSSVVGMLLEHEEEYTVVKSRNNGLLQHDAFSWEVVGNKFIYLDSISDGSRMIDKKMKKFLSDMTKEEREKFVESIFDAIHSMTGAKTVSELTGEKLKLFKVWGALDETARTQLKRVVSLIVGKKKQENKKQEKKQEIAIHEKRKK